MKRLLLVAAVCLSAGTLGATIAQAGGTAAQINCVGPPFAYSPDLVTVPVGGTVEWVCNFNAHPLISDDGLWPTNNSGTADFGFAFQSNGTFAFHCQIHGGSGMKGKVVVGTGAKDPPAGLLPGPPKIEASKPSYRTVAKLRKTKRFRICLRANEPVKRTVKARAVGKGGKSLFSVTVRDKELVDTDQDCVMSRKLSTRVLRKLGKFKGKQVNYTLTVTVTDADGETAGFVADAIPPRR